MKIESIMIIDDCEADHFITQHVVNNFSPSIKIFNAYDGEEALEILRTLGTQPTVILLDINMPGMDGFAFLEEYSQWKNTSYVVSMHTSSSQEDDKKKALKYEIVKGYFIKSITEINLMSLEDKTESSSRTGEVHH